MQTQRIRKVPQTARYNTSKGLRGAFTSRNFEEKDIMEILEKNRKIEAKESEILARKKMNKSNFRSQRDSFTSRNSVSGFRTSRNTTGGLNRR